MTSGGSGARGAILDACRQLIEESNSGEVGLSAIGRRAGYSRQAIYRHFGTRAGLIRAVLADLDERAGADAAVQRILAAGDGAAVIDALVAWWSDYVDGFIGVARSVLTGRRSDAALAAAWDDRMDALLAVCGMAVDRCLDDGLLRAKLPPTVAAEMLWALLSIPLWDQLINDRGWNRTQYRQRIGLMARAALIDES